MQKVALKTEFLFFLIYLFSLVSICVSYLFTFSFIIIFNQFYSLFYRSICSDFTPEPPGTKAWLTLNIDDYNHINKIKSLLKLIINVRKKYQSNNEINSRSIVYSTYFSSIYFILPSLSISTLNVCMEFNCWVHLLGAYSYYSIVFVCMYVDSWNQFCMLSCSNGLAIIYFSFLYSTSMLFHIFFFVLSLYIFIFIYFFSFSLLH